MGAVTFEERWGIKLTDAESFRRLKNLLCNLVDLIGEDASEYQVTKFANRLGESRGNVATYDMYNMQWSIDLRRLVSNATTPQDLARFLEAAITSVDMYSSDDVCEEIRSVLDNNGASFDLVKAGGGWLMYPRGEKKLDQKVEAALGFVEGAVLREFSHALENYARQDWVGSAEKSRRTLEEYLRSVLGRPKIGLDAAIKEMGLKMKQESVAEHLRGLIVGELRLLDGHFNSSSKHASATQEPEAEYIIYRVASIMLLIWKNK